MYSEKLDAVWHRNKWNNNPEYREQKLARSEEWRKSNQAKKNAGLRQRRQRNRQDRIEYLGGKCVGCGTTENLEFDHIDRTLKEFTISKKPDYTFERIKPELDKCRLLCKDCHAVKTRAHHDNDELLKGYNLESIVNKGDTITITYKR